MTGTVWKVLLLTANEVEHYLLTSLEYSLKDIDVDTEHLHTKKSIIDIQNKFTRCKTQTKINTCWLLCLRRVR